MNGELGRQSGKRCKVPKRHDHPERMTYVTSLRIVRFGSSQFLHDTFEDTEQLGLWILSDVLLKTIIHPSFLQISGSSGKDSLASYTLKVASCHQDPGQESNDWLHFAQDEQPQRCLC